MEPQSNMPPPTSNEPTPGYPTLQPPPTASENPGILIQI